MKALSLILSILANACGPDFIFNNNTIGNGSGLGIDEVFHEYVATFESYTKKQVTNVDMVFVTGIGGQTIGQCIIQGGDVNQRRLIKIDRRVWDRGGENIREALIMHELGHCVLNKEHNSGTRLLGGTLCASSIMHPDMSAILPCYGEQRLNYLNEFFYGTPW